MLRIVRRGKGDEGMATMARFDFDQMTDDELVRHVYSHCRAADDLIEEKGVDNAAVAVHERQARRALNELSKRNTPRARAIATELGWPN